MAKKPASKMPQMPSHRMPDGGKMPGAMHTPEMDRMPMMPKGMPKGMPPKGMGRKGK